jgi:hypothetical protein
VCTRHKVIFFSRARAGETELLSVMRGVFEACWWDGLSCCSAREKNMWHVGMYIFKFADGHSRLGNTWLLMDKIVHLREVGCKVNLIILPLDTPSLVVYYIEIQLSSDIKSFWWSHIFYGEQFIFLLLCFSITNETIIITLIFTF